VLLAPLSPLRRAYPNKQMARTAIIEAAIRFLLNGGPFGGVFDLGNVVVGVRAESSGINNLYESEEKPNCPSPP
jgi:hypothetical protein